MEEQTIDSIVIQKITSKVLEVQEKGFGEVVIYIRNGHVSRIKTTVEFMQKDRKKIGEAEHN
jgi:hypothetical protein